MTISTFDIEDAQELGRPAPPLDLSIDQQVLGLQRGVLDTLMSPPIAQRLLNNAAKVDDPRSALKLSDLYATLHNAVWSELRSGNDITLFRRNLQREYALRVANALVRPSDSMPADARALLRVDAHATARRAPRGADAPHVGGSESARFGNGDDAGRSAKSAARPSGGLTAPVRRAPAHGRAAASDRRSVASEDRRVTGTLTLAPIDNRALANLCGALDANLRQIEAALDVTIARRGAAFNVTGAPAQVEHGERALQRFYAEAEKPLSVDDIQLGLVEIAARRPASPPRRAGARCAASSGEGQASSKAVRCCARGAPTCTGARRTRSPISKRSSRTTSRFGIGPAGTGKTYLAVACAVDALERDAVKRIVLVRPAVEAGERLGFLPGDLAQKVDPYLRPLFDALYDLMGFDKAAKLLERQTIELAPLAYMRGRTLNHSFIILDEAQNTTPEQMKMFLTRIGFGTKAVITGDITQIDLARGQKSGLIEAERVLKGVRGHRVRALHERRRRAPPAGAENHRCVRARYRQQPLTPTEAARR